MNETKLSTFKEIDVLFHDKPNMKPSLILDPAFCLMAVAMGAVGVTSYVTKVGNLNLLQASAKEVSAALDAGQVTSLQLVNAYLDRIEAHNINGTSDTLDALMHSSISNIHRPWSPRYHRDRTRRQRQDHSQAS